MRTQADRIRHAIFFELFALFFAIPLASYLVGTDLGHMSVLAIGMSLCAMFWNWFYNIIFDHILVYIGRSLVNRSPWLRVIHAIMFELSFTVVTLPAIMWWLGLSLWKALTMDLGFTLFYMIYGYIYNWIYDKVFPYQEVVKS